MSKHATKMSDTHYTIHAFAAPTALPTVCNEADFVAYDELQVPAYLRIHSDCLSDSMKAIVSAHAAEATEAAGKTFCYEGNLAVVDRNARVWMNGVPYAPTRANIYTIIVNLFK